ncbi:hypothetical protein PV10_01145 [Exophiala mesophila]|uniref:SPRY domain-containing protein n=1 Tax=Exophiala mesophila TaxID=212818 RepID=A0A0D1ZTX7_EXOME|nr:uncharacterized protein PV10_01145 [Exophiala mesophila]KIV97389.1 hypothetical protein PV10_01145 [Exophiala mesophila]
MGLFRSLKGKVDVGTDDPPKPTQTASSHDGWSVRDEKRRIFGGGSSGDRNQHSQSSSSRAPTPHHDQYNAPPGPPPSQRIANDQYVPPEGPPPSHGHRLTQTEFQPPAGPPPTQASNPPPYHDWTVIPDTSLLPPPPAITEEFSPTNNASWDSAARAHDWCEQNLVFTPSIPSSRIHVDSQAGRIGLDPPPAQLWRGSSVRQLSPISYRVKTSKGQQDAILLSTLPIYFAAADNPLQTQQEKTIYFEIRVINIANENSGIAIGFSAKPYPPWRLPGWHRASLGIHGDDGRRFVNDSGGGRDFVTAFRPGETLGVGMTFSTDELRASGPEGRVKTRVFLTRGGARGQGDGWEIDEERDAVLDPIEGLMGEGDLYAAVGVFGGLEFEVNLGKETWLWKPRG